MEAVDGNIQGGSVYSLAEVTGVGKAGDIGA
jgi:hypothetical protein